MSNSIQELSGIENSPTFEKIHLSPYPSVRRILGELLFVAVWVEVKRGSYPADRVRRPALRFRLIAPSGEESSFQCTRTLGVNVPTIEDTDLSVPKSSRIAVILGEDRG